MSVILLLLAGCVGSEDCEDGTVWSPALGQCIGVEEPEPEPEPTTPTGDTADTASTG